MSEGRPDADVSAGVFALLIGIGVLAKFWMWILLIVGVVVLGIVLGLLMWRAALRVDARIAEQAAIAARADEQHTQFLAGDDRGMYGLYPPAVAPGPPPAVEPRPRPGENWADYLAETRERAKVPVVHTGSGSVRWL